MVLCQLGHLELAEGDVVRAREMFAESATIFQSIGNPMYLCWTLEGLAGVAAERHSWEQVARLCGSRGALRARIGSRVPPVYAEGYASMMQAVRSALGPASFARAYETGEKALLAETIAEALRDFDSGTNAR